MIVLYAVISNKCNYHAIVGTEGEMPKEDRKRAERSYDKKLKVKTKLVKFWETLSMEEANKVTVGLHNHFSSNATIITPGSMNDFDLIMRAKEKLKKECKKL